MTSKQTPHSVLATPFITTGQRLAGTLPLSSLSRLASKCGVDALTGDIAFELEGEVIHGIQCLRGYVKASVPLMCQRCMQTTLSTVESRFAVVPITRDEEAEEVPMDFEPLLLVDDVLDIPALLEDELLLIVPEHRTHDLADCSVKISSWHYGDELNIDQETRPNPFARLSAFKRQQ